MLVGTIVEVPPISSPLRFPRSSRQVLFVQYYLLLTCNRRLQLATVRSQLHLTESTTESELSHISAMDTPRLHLSIMSPDYLDDFHRIWSNPEATQWR
jgi:hypothetical protein